MEFTKDFFKGEIKNSFYIDRIMKKAWAAQLEVLGEIDQICKKHHIKYFADWGTLLGTVRHQGFIPWDDDIDISMLRDDYERFWRVAVEELPEEYLVQNVNTDSNWREMLTRVANSSMIDFGKERLERFHGFPYLVGIDVFPLDYQSPIPEEEAMRSELVKMTYQTAGLVIFERDTNTSKQETQDMVYQIQELCGVTFTEDTPVERQLYVLCENLSKMFLKEEAKEVRSLAGWVDDYINAYFPIEWFSEEQYLPFEMFQMPVPKHSDEILKREYGEDCMIPRIKTGGHDYPFFKKQQKKVIKELGYIPDYEGRF